MLSLLVTSLAGGCVSIEQLAPPVGTLSNLPAASRITQLEHGRTLYVTKCAKCHSPEPVHGYSAARWSDIIPEMATEAKLVPAETDAVRAYVFAVLTSRSAASH